MSKLIKVEGYKQLLDPIQTELGIKQIKDFFQANLSTALRLRRVTAPLFVMRGLGLNDDLNGVERPSWIWATKWPKWYIHWPSGSA